MPASHEPYGSRRVVYGFDHALTAFPVVVKFLLALVQFALARRFGWILDFDQHGQSAGSDAYVGTSFAHSGQIQHRAPEGAESRADDGVIRVRACSVASHSVPAIRAAGFIRCF